MHSFTPKLLHLSTILLWTASLCYSSDNGRKEQGKAAKGCVVVAAAGNNGNSPVLFPANIPGVISVGAINDSGVRCISENDAIGSGIGPNLDLVAPGANILGYTGVNTLSYSSGTSFAAPLVSGVVALMMERNPNLTNTEIANILFRTAKKKDYMNLLEYGDRISSWNHEYGYGILNAYEAIINTPKVEEK